MLDVIASSASTNSNCLGLGLGSAQIAHQLCASSFYSASALQAFTVLLFLSIAVDVLKRVLKIQRPAGARACDALAVGGESKTYGMPSGHVATAVAGWYLMTRSPAAAAAAFLLMSYARVAAGCHTLLQCVAGGLLAWLLVVRRRL